LTFNELIYRSLYSVHTDNKIKEEVEKVNAADSMIFQTEKQLKEYGDKIPDEKKKPIEEALTELKAAHAAKDLAAIDASMEKLNTSFQAASQDMYNATQGASENPEQPKKEDNKNEEEVTDVDFEEV
jgi:molecular chaperone DnaK